MTQLPMEARSNDAQVAREDLEEERRWRIQHGHDLARVTAERDDLLRKIAIAEHAGAWVPEVDELSQTILWDAPCRCHGVVV